VVFDAAAGVTVTTLAGAVTTTVRDAVLHPVAVSPVATVPSDPWSLAILGP
jgi:hypothetical protein